MGLKKYIKTIKQGFSLKDKVLLAIFTPIDKVFEIKDLKLNLVLANQHGKFFCRNLRDVFMYSTNREKELRSYFKVSDEGIILDVGANIGKYSILMANKYSKCKIIAIEPDKRCTEIMRKNIKLNNLNNIEIIDKVASDKPGEIDFYLNEKNPARNTLFKKELTGQSSYNGDKNDTDLIPKKRTIKSITLDSIPRKGKKIIFIKIDVQGAELLVFKGSRNILKNDHPTILFEAWDKNFLEKIRDFLVGYGYKIKKIDKYNFIAT